MDNISDDILIEVQNYLSRYGDQLVTDIRLALKDNDKLASGNLYNSVQFEVTTSDSIVTMNINALEYLKYIDLGRRPGAKQIPIEALIQWIEIRGIRARGIPEHKQKTPETNEQLAWAFAKSIQNRGIPATGVIQNPFNKTKDKLSTEISQVLATGNSKATGKMLQDLATQYKNSNIKIEISY